MTYRKELKLVSKQWSHTLWYLLIILSNSNYTLNTKKKKKSRDLYKLPKDLYKLPKSIYHSLFIPFSVLHSSLLFSFMALWWCFRWWSSRRPPLIIKPPQIPGCNSSDSSVTAASAPASAAWQQHQSTLEIDILGDMGERGRSWRQRAGEKEVEEILIFVNYIEIKMIFEASSNFARILMQPRSDGLARAKEPDAPSREGANPTPTLKCYLHYFFILYYIIIL